MNATGPSQKSPPQFFYDILYKFLSGLGPVYGSESDHLGK